MSAAPLASQRLMRRLGDGQSGRGRALLMAAIKQPKELEVEAMFSTVVPGIKRRARHVGLQRRPDGYRIEPMPQLRWYS